MAVSRRWASCIARNLQRLRIGAPLDSFIWKDLGEMMGLGIGQASLTGMGVTLAGPAAFQLRRLAYLARMPGLPQQLKVASWRTSPAGSRRPKAETDSILG